MEFYNVCYPTLTLCQSNAYSENFFENLSGDNSVNIGAVPA